MTKLELTPRQKAALTTSVQTVQQISRQLEQARQNYSGLGAMILEGAGVDVDRLDHFQLDGDTLIYELKEDVGTEQDA